MEVVAAASKVVVGWCDVDQWWGVEVVCWVFQWVESQMVEACGGEVDSPWDGQEGFDLVGVV